MCLYSVAGEIKCIQIRQKHVTQNYYNVLYFCYKLNNYIKYYLQSLLTLLFLSWHVLKYLDLKKAPT